MKQNNVNVESYIAETKVLVNWYSNLNLNLNPYLNLNLNQHLNQNLNPILNLGSAQYSTSEKFVLVRFYLLGQDINACSTINIWMNEKGTFP